MVAYSVLSGGLLIGGWICTGVGSHMMGSTDSRKGASGVWVGFAMLAASLALAIAGARV